jgi:hypothetical protein
LLNDGLTFPRVSVVVLRPDGARMFLWSPSYLICGQSNTSAVACRGMAQYASTSSARRARIHLTLSLFTDLGCVERSPAYPCGSEDNKFREWKDKATRNE